MTESIALGVRRRWRPGARFLFRTARRMLAESVYLLTAPVLAAAGLLMVLGGLAVATAASHLPGGSRCAAGALAMARWPGDLERWRIARLRPLSAGTQGARPRPRPRQAAASDPGLWLDAVHAVVVLPVTLITSAVTALWWFIGAAGATVVLRDHYLSSDSLRPETAYAGSAGRAAFGTVIGLVLLFILPLVTRACAGVQTRLGQALLWDASPLHRRIRGLERERDTARAQTVAAVTAEAAALRRLERDIHDGPQQRLVRLAMELGRAQHHLDSRPEAVREALADAIVQTREALEELRALSRGIAPPILADRGLREALTALAARAAIPVELDAPPLGRRLDAAVETAAYFAAAEALTNVAKHSQARHCVIGLRHQDGTLRVWVTDDGMGGAALDKGHGLRGLNDRLHAAGGRLQVVSPPGGPTTVTAELPCR